jgi:hypothetical protein
VELDFDDEEEDFPLNAEVEKPPARPTPHVAKNTITYGVNRRHGRRGNIPSLIGSLQT